MKRLKGMRISESLFFFMSVAKYECYCCSSEMRGSERAYLYCFRIQFSIFQVSFFRRDGAFPGMVLC